MSASYCGQIRRRSNLGSGGDLTFSQGDHAGMSVEMMTGMMTGMMTRTMAGMMTGIMTRMMTGMWR